MIVSTMTVNIVPVNIQTGSIMMLCSIRLVVIILNDYTECHNAECHCVDCRGASLNAFEMLEEFYRQKFSA